MIGREHTLLQYLSQHMKRSYLSNRHKLFDNYAKTATKWG